MNTFTTEQLDALPTAERKWIAIRAVADLSSADKREVAAAAGLPPPSNKVNDIIWLTIVWSFAAAFIAAAAVLLVGRFASVTEAAGEIVTSNETVLTIFTTTAAFLAGLLAPSPLKGDSGG